MSCMKQMLLWLHKDYFFSWMLFFSCIIIQYNISIDLHLNVHSYAAEIESTF